MARRTIFTMISLALTSFVSLLADDNAPQLPKDGWWIRYHTKIKQNGPIGPQDYTAISTWSLVGTEIVDNEKCRWLEIDSLTTYRDTKHSVLSKYLIPEKDLRRAESLTKNVKRGWITVNGGDVHQANEDRNKLKQHMAFYFDSAWNDSEKVDEVKVIEYQHGRLEVAHGRKLIDTATRPQKNQETPQRLVTERTAWFDPKTAPLLSAMNTHFKNYVNDEVHSSRDDEIVVEDSGTDAKTKLPEHN